MGKDPLEKLNNTIDFELIRATLNMIYQKTDRKSKAGAKPYDYVLMFKVIILQRLYNLSDEQMEFQPNERLTFKRYVGLDFSHKVPDTNTFKEKLKDNDNERKLFDYFYKQLEEQQLLVSEGKMVDASFHEVGYNYRMTNVTAAIGVAQMENLDNIIENKRKTAEKYREFFQSNQSTNHSIIEFISEPAGSFSNYWLNCFKLETRESRNKFVEETNSNGVMTRPIWRLMNKLEMYKNCQAGNLDNSEWLEDRTVNLPSGFRKK